MKKAVAISFLLLANIVILAHVIVPHLHHDRVPVALSSHIEHEAPLNDMQDHTGMEDCLLSQVYARMDNERQLSQSIDFDISLFPLLSLFLPEGSFSETTYLEGFPFRQKPYIKSFHTTFISRSTGLRAPPVC